MFVSLPLCPECQKDVGDVDSILEEALGAATEEVEDVKIDLFKELNLAATELGRSKEAAALRQTAIDKLGPSIKALALVLETFQTFQEASEAPEDHSELDDIFKKIRALVVKLNSDEPMPEPNKAVGKAPGFYGTTIAPVAVVPTKPPPPPDEDDIPF